MSDASAAVAAVVPAPGGPLGFTGRDVAVVGGRPLVARIVRTLQQAGLPRVVVATDSPTVAGIAAQTGAEVVAARPAAVDLLLDALGDEELAVVAYPGCPFTTADDVRGVVDLVRSGGFDCGLAVTTSRDHLWDVQGTGVNHDPAQPRDAATRELQFREIGSLYAMRTAGLREHHRMFFGHIGLHEVPGHRALAIDTPEDLEAARLLAPLRDEPDAIDVDAVVTGFEGTHTSDEMLLLPDGSEAAWVRRSDGDAVRALVGGGVRVLVLSADPGPLPAQRAARLGAEVAHPVADRAAALGGWLQYARLDPGRTAYLGRDLADLPAMRLVGWPVAVADAHPRVLASARLVLARAAGDGAVRDLAERVLDAR